jgi:hypothetical protein
MLLSLPWCGGPHIPEQRRILQHATVVGGTEQDMLDQFGRNGELF